MPTSGNFSVNKLNERGVVPQLVILLLLVAGIGAGLYLISHPQIFKPKASSEVIEWLTPSGDSKNCVSVKDGKKVATCATVQFRVNLPGQGSTSNNSDTGSTTNQNQGGE